MKKTKGSLSFSIIPDTVCFCLEVGTEIIANCGQPGSAEINGIHIMWESQTADSQLIKSFELALNFWTHKIRLVREGIALSSFRPDARRPVEELQK